MKKTTILAILLAITSIYLVGIGLPAVAYTAIPISAMYIIKYRRDIRFSKSDIVFLSAMLVFLMWIFVRGNLSDRATGAFIVNLGMASLVYLVFSQKMEERNATRVLVLTIVSFAIVATVDTLYKFEYPKEFDDAPAADQDFWDLGFYAYKGSLFYLDSNALAFLLIPILFVLFNNAHITNRHPFLNFLKYYLLVLLALTFSRAGYVAGALVVVGSVRGKYLKLFINTAILIVLYFLYDIVSSDRSLAFKFKEVGLVYEHISSGNFFQLIFGRGFGWGDKNLFFLQGSVAKTLIEIGLIGFTFYIVALCALMHRSQAKLYYIAFFIFSQSSNFYFFPAFSIGILLLHEVIMKRGYNLKASMSRFD